MLKNVSLRPLNDMNNIYYKDIQKWKIQRKEMCTSQGKWKMDPSPLRF